MHAIRHHSFGPPTTLVLDDLPDLSPDEGQVRIAVAAAGVHLLDTSLRRGDDDGPMSLPELSTVPGREVAGFVDVVGAGVDDGVGGDVGRAAFELLRPGGRLVMFGFSAGTPTRFDSGDLVSGDRA